MALPKLKQAARIIIIIIKVFLKRKILSLETILSARARARTHPHTHTHTRILCGHFNCVRTYATLQNVPVEIVEMYLGCKDCVRTYATLQTVAAEIVETVFRM